MRCFAMPVLILLAAAAIPAEAQIAGRHDYEDVGPSNPFIGDSSLGGPGIGRELGDVRGSIRRAREDGILSRGEARRLNREARQIGRLAERYGQGGVSPGERRELEARTQALRDAVRRAGTGGGG